MTDRRDERRARVRPERGWFRLDADLWPEIAEALGNSGAPWPENAVLADIAWWLDRIEQGGAKMPVRRALAARWRWSEWAVRQVLIDAAAQDPPNRRPTAAQDPPAPATLNADNAAGSAQPPPKIRPTAAQDPPTLKVLVKTSDDQTSDDHDRARGRAPARANGAGLFAPPMQAERDEAHRIRERHRARWAWADDDVDLNARWPAIVARIPPGLRVADQLARMDGWLAENAPPKRTKALFFWRRLDQFVTGEVAQRIAREAPVAPPPAAAPARAPAEAPPARPLTVAELRAQREAAAHNLASSPRRKP